jgi:hypothetical protein
MAKLADLAKEFAEACHFVDVAKAELDAMKKQKEEIMGRLVDFMIDEEVTNLKVETPNGRRTVFLHTDTIANLEKSDEAIEAFRAAGGDALVKQTVNAQSFRAWVREHIDEDADPGADIMDRLEIDEDLKPFVKVFEKTTARAKKG